MILPRHCVGSNPATEDDCSAGGPRHYDQNKRIGFLFAVLGGSILGRETYLVGDLQEAELTGFNAGVFGPMWIRKQFPRNGSVDKMLHILKQFGTGVIISTAFVHVIYSPSLRLAL
jgi:solute carrier family 39 (zinc transporter), member 1/2/3